MSKPRSVIFEVSVVALIGVLIAIILVAASGQRYPTPRRTRDVPPEGGTDRIRMVLDSQVAAWNRRDLEDFMAGYWKSDDLTFYSGGDITTGWDATLARYHKRYVGEGKEMGQLTFSDVHVALVGLDDAIVRGRWKVVTTKAAPSGLFTLRFRYFADGGWKIVHDHTSAADPPQPAKPE